MGACLTPMHINKDGKYVETAADKKFFAKLACSLPKMLGGGHKRGKRVNPGNSVSPIGVLFKCPRCGDTWTRKVKA